MNVHPNAKINIGLNITGLLPNGYHSIETVYYPVDIFDHLEVEFLPDANENQFFVKGLPIEGKPENNLVIKAWQLLEMSIIQNSAGKNFSGKKYSNGCRFGRWFFRCRIYAEITQ
jgi:4-diphosphocytidyl-2-C-methyl-D-erythritol kinase